MSKQSGLGARCLVGGYDISGDVQALDSVSGTAALLDVTDITQSAHSRIGGLRDGSMSFTTFFDSGNATPVLDALSTSDQLMSFLVPPMSVGSPAACLNAKQVGYDPTRGTDGSLTLKTEGQGQGYGLEWGLALTPGVRADSSATNGTALDNGASTAYGCQLYLQVTAFTGSSATITVQHSADNSTWSTLQAFATVDAAPYTERDAVANTSTVDRYVRVISAGTFTALSFAVVLCRNSVAGVVF
jgi:hypothetical protein